MSHHSIIYQPRMADLRWRYYRGEADDRTVARALAIESDRMLDIFRQTIAANRAEALLTHYIAVTTGVDEQGMYHELHVADRPA